MMSKSTSSFVILKSDLKKSIQRSSVHLTFIILSELLLCIQFMILSLASLLDTDKLFNFT